MGNKKLNLKRQAEQSKKESKLFGWVALLFGLLLLIDGCIKIFFNITWIGWSIKSQHETYNNGWYFLFIGLMLSIGAVLRIRSGFSNNDE